MQAKRKEASEHEARREKRRKVFRDRNIFSNARATFQPDPAANQAWSDAYNEVAIKWGRSARDALQRKREQLIAQGGVHQPMPDDQYTWEIVWNLITTDFHASRPTPQDQARFRVLHARIQSEKRYHNTLILPSFLRSASLGTMRPDTFCEALSQEITTQRLARVNQAWNDASAQAGSRRRRNLIRDRIALRHDVRAGFEPYGPLAAPPRRGVDRDAVAPTLPFDAQSALPGTWRYGAKLGSSAQGIASLWERVDAAGWVVDRVVAKETYMRQPGQWDAPRYWDGAVSQRVPLEFSIASYVGRSPEALHVVRHLSYGIYEQWPMYRMYMEFCPRGDLEDSIGKYASQNARKSGRDMDLVPVRACWAVFEALASVLCLMYVGGFPDEGGAMQRHAAVLHRDLKPANSKSSCHSLTGENER
jgi:serine/threonine protein kinase